MVLVKNWPFFHLLFFRQYRPRKCVLRYSTIKKHLSRLSKKTSSKSRKIEIFPKALTHGFGQKFAIFHLFLLGSIGQENVFYDILERKNAFLGYKNNKFKKSKNWDFSTGVNQWFWSKIGHFCIFFFLGNIGQENMFYKILERKNAFLGYKKKKFKNLKNWDFSKE